MGIDGWEKEYISELARRYAEIAGSDEMKAKEALWFNHNDLKTKEPVILVESDSFAASIMPKSKCESPLAKEMEYYFQLNISHYKYIQDDRVLPRYYELNRSIGWDEFGLDTSKEYSTAIDGSTLGFRQKHPIITIEEDLWKIRESKYYVNNKDDQKKKDVIEDVIGNITPVRFKNNSMNWSCTPSYKIDSLMGLENMMVSMAVEPENMHKLYRVVTDKIKDYLRFTEENGLLYLNNGNDYTGSGSYGFTSELPKSSSGSRMTTKNLWGNLNSQETVSISPAMFEEIVFPYYKEVAEEFGLIYYGCCEPVHSIWENCLSKLPNLRKLSISPWCDEEYMGDALKNSEVIYCRKVSPNFLGITSDFDEAAFTGHIEKTLAAAKGCYLEFSFRDIYTLKGNTAKLQKSIDIIRNLTQNI